MPSGTVTPVGFNGGAGAGPSCVFTTAATIDIHAVGSHLLAFDTIVNDIFDYAPIAPPPGLGFSGPTAGIITTTVAGVWAFSLALDGQGADANIRGFVENAGFTFDSVNYGPALSGSMLSMCEVEKLPAGVDISYIAHTTTGAAANPFGATPNLIVTRLA